MDPNYMFPASPGTPLFQVSPDRVNQQRFDPNSPLNAISKHSRESSVHDKAAKFDSLAFQGKALERKANDAALKRAMVGREEAESEMRRYRDEAKQLRKQIEEGKDRERKVGERLESVMENYGRAKETHAHTQTLWEKEIRRARKEAFKSQSVFVKMQEELKSTRNSLRLAQGGMEQEKDRSMKREQEAFAARYQLVGVQEELALMAEKVKLAEQERDALRTIAKNEEIARIAAEGHIPLPSSRKDEEFASPRKASAPLPPVTIISSAASEEEIEHLREELHWERQRAERAFEHVEYIQLECQFRCCSCRNADRDGQEGSTHVGTNTKAPVESRSASPIHEKLHSPSSKQQNMDLLQYENFDLDTPQAVSIPKEDVFRCVEQAPEASTRIPHAKTASTQLDMPLEISEITYTSAYARTPSCDPPSTARVPEVNASLLSLLDEPASPTSNTSTIYHDTEHSNQVDNEESAEANEYAVESEETTPAHTFQIISTTTRVPLADSPALTPPSFSVAKDSEFTPTMTREEALAQIRERRGRARSLAQGTLTPRKQMVDSATTRRDISAPAVRSGSIGRGKLQARA